MEYGRAFHSDYIIQSQDLYSFHQLVGKHVLYFSLLVLKSFKNRSYHETAVILLFCTAMLCYIRNE